MKSVRIRSYSGPYFSAFGLNTERYSVSLRIQFECGKMRTRITPNTDTFYGVDLPQVKWYSISSTKNILDEVPDELPNELRLRISGN